jgi:hypothetical protein
VQAGQPLGIGLFAHPGKHTPALLGHPQGTGLANPRAGPGYHYATRHLSGFARNYDFRQHKIGKLLEFKYALKG